MRYLSTIIIFVLIVFSSCTKEKFYDGDHFFITNKGAEMPVYIKGNIESNTFILYMVDLAAMVHWFHLCL